MKKLVRITTVPISLEKLLEGQLNFMEKEYKVIAVSSDEKKLNELGKKIKIETFAVNMTREITPVKDIISVYRLYHFFKKENPFIVHTHTPKAGISGMLAAKIAGVPIRLHTVAGLPLLEAKGAKRKILEYVEKITFACATRVYPNSRKIFQYLRDQKYVSEKKLKVIGNGSSNGIDTGYFDPQNYPQAETLKFRKSLGIPSQNMVFVFVGRLVRDKGINELVEAFEKIHLNYPKTSLLLVGPFETELDPLKKTTIEKMKTHPDIIEAGYQNDVRPFLACADVLTFPSYREGFPNVVMQAGAMGLPCIVSDINGCNEIIREGINGTIVPVRDMDALYKAMEKMITDKSYKKRLQENSRRIIKENYERKAIWEALLAEYKRLETDLIK